jgi:single-strand DNA-binding protein
MKVTLEGGVVFQPELRFSAAGKPWAKARIASKESKPDGRGGWEDGPSVFTNIICFGQMAENLIESVTVGDQIVVVGRLEENVWEKDGVTHTDLQIIPDLLGVSLRFGAAKTKRVLDDTGRAAPEMDSAGESPVPF